MKLYKKSEEIGRYAVLVIIVLLATLLVMLIIVGHSKGFMTYYLGKIFS